MRPLQQANIIIEIKLDETYSSDQEKEAWNFKYLNEINNKSQIEQGFDNMGINNSIGADWFMLEDVVLFRFYM